jgi:hypothetical protein
MSWGHWLTWTSFSYVFPEFLFGFAAVRLLNKRHRVSATLAESGNSFGWRRLGESLGWTWIFPDVCDATCQNAMAFPPKKDGKNCTSSWT